MFARTKRHERFSGRVDKVYVRRRTSYPLEPCGDYMSAVEKRRISVKKGLKARETWLLSRFCYEENAKRVELTVVL